MKRDYKIVKKDREGLDAVRRPTAIEVAWAAGIYEGEGSCVTNHNGKGSMSFSVTVAQKDPELLYRMRDLFGGTISHYERIFNKKVCPIFHWKICGDRARTFIGVIYPFLTARRKQQVEATPAGHFIELAQDLIQFDLTLGKSQVYESLWNKIDEYDAQQRVKAHEHKNQYQKEYWAKQSADPEYRERKRLAQQERRKIKKEQLQAGVIKLVAAA
jgi:hypothetical protein